MSIDTAFDRLRNANPYPDPAALRKARRDPAAFLATTEQRSTQMPTDERDGTFRVLDRQGVTLDNGTYLIADDVITFVSETPAPLWHRDPLMGAADPSSSIRGNLSCEQVGGDYPVVQGDAGQLVLEVVWDECPSRLTVARGLQFRLGA